MDIPKLKPNMIVTTPNSNLRNITPQKNYIVRDIDDRKGTISVKDDKGLVNMFSSVDFIESDVYFTLILYITLEKIL